MLASQAKAVPAKQEPTCANRSVERYLLGDLAMYRPPAGESMLKLARVNKCLGPPTRAKFQESPQVTGFSNCDVVMNFSRPSYIPREAYFPARINPLIIELRRNPKLPGPLVSESMKTIWIMTFCLRRNSLVVGQISLMNLLP